MSEKIGPDTLADPRDQAAHWYERLQSDDMSEQEQRDFQVWLEADAAHPELYRQAQHIWSLAAALPKAQVSQLNTERVAVSRPARRVSWRHGAAAAMAALLAVAILSPRHWFAEPQYQAQFSTVHGERRQLVLTDDSTLTLNTDTSINVELYEHQRIVRLGWGEVFFEVDGTRGTPFIVQTEQGNVRVTGTQFNVRQTGESLAVDVVKGSVEVKTGPWWRRRIAMLQAGEVARTDVSGSLHTYSDVAVSDTVVWRQGQVIFRGTPLGEAVQELNRYITPRIIVRGAQVAHMRVSGVFNTDDPASFLTALPQILPVSVHARSEGSVIEALVP